MQVVIEFKNGDRKEFSECDNIKYHTGFVEIVRAYYSSESFPADSIKSITQESRRSF